MQSDLAAGRLVTPLEGRLSRSKGYYIVGRDAARDSLHIGPFWQWLWAQATDGIIAEQRVAQGKSE